MSCATQNSKENAHHTVHTLKKMKQIILKVTQNVFCFFSYKKRKKIHDEGCYR